MATTVELVFKKSDILRIPQVLKEGRKNKQSDLSTPMKVRAAARAMAADTMNAQVNDEDTMIAKTWQFRQASRCSVHAYFNVVQ